MRNLLNFIIKYSTWFVFTFYVLLSLILIFFNNRYQNVIWLTSSNAVSSTLLGWTNEVTGYFNLKEINFSLQQRNAALEIEVLNLKNEISAYKSLLNDTLLDSPPRFDYIVATVLNNTVRHPRNYITIDKGSDDGVEPGMGVVDQNGIVGIVNVTGHKTSRVISLLNTSQKFSVKIKGTQMAGSLSWKGNDPKIAYLEEVPRHAEFNIGDTVVTSGYSTTFPADMNVGVILGRVKSMDDNFYNLKILLTSNFSNLSNVRIIKDLYKNELDSLTTFDITD